MLPSYPRSRIALADAVSAAIAWFLLVLLAVTLIGCVAKIAGFIEAFLLVVQAFLVFSFLHLIFCFCHWCPNCRKHPTLQGFEPPHILSVNQSKLAGWAGAEVNILRRRHLVCIHCGMEYLIAL